MRLHGPRQRQRTRRAFTAPDSSMGACTARHSLRHRPACHPTDSGFPSRALNHHDPDCAKRANCLIFPFTSPERADTTIIRFRHAARRFAIGQAYRNQHFPTNAVDDTGASGARSPGHDGCGRYCTKHQLRSSDHDSGIGKRVRRDKGPCIRSIIREAQWGDPALPAVKAAA
jgi:hypothetical protein